MQRREDRQLPQSRTDQGRQGHQPGTEELFGADDRSAGGHSGSASSPQNRRGLSLLRRVHWPHGGFRPPNLDGELKSRGVFLWGPAEPRSLGLAEAVS